MTAYDWSMSKVLLLVMLSQLMGILHTAESSGLTAGYGRQTSLGPFRIGNENDEPYSDRSMVCVRHGRRYKATTVNEVLCIARRMPSSLPSASSSLDSAAYSTQQ